MEEAVATQRRGVKRERTVRRQRVLRLAVPTRLLPTLKRSVIEQLHSQNGSMKYDGNKIEDLILRALCDFATFAGIPPAHRLAALERALPRHIAQSPRYRSSFCAAWHFSASTGAQDENDQDGTLSSELAALRALILETLSEREEQQRSQRSASSDCSKAIPETPPYATSACDVASTQATVETLRQSGCRITRSVQAWLTAAATTTARQGPATDAAPSRMQPVALNAHTTTSDTGQCCGTVQQLHHQRQGTARIRTRCGSSSAIPTRVPLSLAPMLLRFLELQLPEAVEYHLQDLLLTELLRIDRVQYVYLPGRGLDTSRGSIRASSHAAGTERQASSSCTRRAAPQTRTDTECPYERVRSARITEHRALLAALGLGRSVAGTVTPTSKKREEATSMIQCKEMRHERLLPRNADTMSRKQSSPLTFAEYVRRADPATSAWMVALDPLWIQAAEQVVAACLVRARDPNACSEGAAPAWSTAYVQRSIWERNDSTQYRKHVQRISERYLLELDSAENRRKRGFRNHPTVYAAARRNAQPGTLSADACLARLTTATLGARSTCGSTLTEEKETTMTTALQRRGSVEEAYLWTEADYDAFFTAWRRFGNSVHANRKIAQAMNEAYWARVPTRKRDALTLKTRQGIGGRVTFLPTHIVYQKRLHRGWLEMHRSENELKLEQLMPAPHQTRCGLCRRDASHDDSTQTGALIGPFWEMLPDAPSTPVWMHRECLLWTPEVFETCEGTMMNVRRTFRRAIRIRCAYCGRTGAATGCFLRYCRRSYHAPVCAVAAGCSLDHRHYRLLCMQHTQVYAKISAKGAALFWESLEQEGISSVK